MAKIKQLLQLAILVLVVLVGIAFLYRNPNVITIDFFVYRSTELTVGVVVLLSFVAGGVMGLLARLPGGFWQASQLKLKNRKLAQKEQELAQLKNESAKVG